MIKQFKNTRYYATPYGEVYSRIAGRFKLMKPCKNKHGYDRYVIYSDKKPKTMFAHQVIYQCWVGMVPDGMHIDHIDFCKTNNNIKNLRAIPAAENYTRKKPKKSTDWHNCKVDQETVLEIKKSYSQGITPYRLHNILGVSLSICKNICYGKTYRDVLP